MGLERIQKKLDVGSTLNAQNVQSQNISNLEKLDLLPLVNNQNPDKKKDYQEQFEILMIRDDFDDTKRLLDMAAPDFTLKQNGFEPRYAKVNGQKRIISYAHKTNLDDGGVQYTIIRVDYSDDGTMSLSYTPNNISKKVTYDSNGVLPINGVITWDRTDDNGVIYQFKYHYDEKGKKVLDDVTENSSMDIKF